MLTHFEETKIIAISKIYQYSNSQILTSLNIYCGFNEFMQIYVFIVTKKKTKIIKVIFIYRRYRSLLDS